MATLKIKKGDNVRVIAGKDKGKEGKVLSVNAAEGTLLVEGVNMIKKHMKPNKDNQDGGIISQEGPINASNVMYLDGGKVSRVGFHIENGKKVRYAKKSNTAID